MPIPTQANFRPSGMAPNVVGGQRVSLTSVGFYNDTRTSGVAPTSGDVLPGRFVALDSTGNFHTNNNSHEPRLGVAAITTGFTANTFAGMALNRAGSTPTRGAIPSAQTVNDTSTITAYRGGDTLSRAVEGEWWVEFDSATVPAAGTAVRVDNVTVGSLGRASATIGVALPTTVAVFTGRVERGWDGKFYASINLPNKLI